MGQEWTSVLAAAALALAPVAAGAATYSDVLPEPGVAWISGAPAAVATDRPAMRQTARTFVPDLLVVPVGSSVTFPNDDAFYHSVYSVSPGNAFDLGLYDTGPGKAVTFAVPGVVDIRCHVHGSMHATIVVVDGPVARTTQPGERFRIDGVAPGRRTLHVWTPEGGESSRPVVVK